MLAAVAGPTAADTTLSSNTLYNNQKEVFTNGVETNDGDGYDTAMGGVYDVTPSATFDNNGTEGLYVNSSTLNPTTVNITGGDFSGDSGGDGLYTNLGSTVNIAGGTFNGDFDGLGAFNSTVNITGGDFTGNSGLSLLSYDSNITLFGTFATYGLVPTAPTFAPSTFTGTLQNSATPQTFKYGELDGGTITLAPSLTSVPEPSSFALLGLGLLPLGLMAKKRMSRRA